MGNTWLDEFCNTIRNQVQQDLANKILHGYEDQDKKDKIRFAEWLYNVMEKFDSLVNADSRKKVMKKMGYNCAKINNSHFKSHSPLIVSAVKYVFHPVT